MEKEKYFIPEIEDIYSGYEYEVRRNDGKWERVTEFSNDYDYEDNPHYAIMKDIKESKIRVSYLTKEQIESEGWKNITLNKSIELHFIKNNNRIQFNNNTMELIISKELDICFRGKCRCINEFRTIMKFLEI